MSLAMLGHKASYEFRWRRWALLRDAVVAYLEDARPGCRFPHFAAIETALGGVSIRLPAAALRQELQTIRTELVARTVDDLVIGEVTASVLYPTVRPAAVRPLTQAERGEIAPPGDSSTLDQYFATMIESMLHVCAHPDPDEMIEVLDG